MVMIMMMMVRLMMAMLWVEVPYLRFVASSDSVTIAVAFVIAVMPFGHID